MLFDLVCMLTKTTVKPPNWGRDFWSLLEVGPFSEVLL